MTLAGVWFPVGATGRQVWSFKPRESNGRFQSTECPCHRHFQPLVPWEMSSAKSINPPSAMYSGLYPVFEDKPWEGGGDTMSATVAAAPPSQSKWVSE